jgi:hypothetical protein
VTVSVEIGNAHGGTEAEQRNVTERGRLCDVRGSGGGVARSERCYRKWMRANGRAGGGSRALRGGNGRLGGRVEEEPDKWA